MSAAATYHATIRKLDMVRQSVGGNASGLAYTIQQRYQNGACQEHESRYLETTEVARIARDVAASSAEGIVR
jgi:hypothetical protein